MEGLNFVEHGEVCLVHDPQRMEDGDGFHRRLP